MKKPFDIALGLAQLASVIVIALNILPRPIEVAVGITLLLATGLSKSWVVCITALALFGLPFLAAVGSLVGLSATSMIMVATFLMAIYALKIISTGASEKENRSNTSKFVVWWISFQALYALQFLIGPNTEHSTFMLQYLLVYGNFNAVGAVITARRMPSVSDILPIGSVLFSFYFPMLGISILKVSSLADSSIGLRAVEGFNSIGVARMSGLLTILALCTYIFSEKRFKNIAYIAAALVASAPLTYYSFTRQVYAAIVLSAVAAFVYKTVKGAGSKRDKSHFSALLSFLIFFGLILYKASSMLMQSKGNRVVEGGIEINRLGLWKETWNLILNDPIMGLGVGGFQQHSSALWPHNWILEAWVELGILGLVIAVLPLIAIGKSMIGRYRSLNSSWIFLGLYYVIVVQVSGDIPRNMEFLFFAGALMCMPSMVQKSAEFSLSRPQRETKANFSYV